MDVSRRGHAQPALKRGGEVGDDVAEQVVGDDHVELCGVLYQVHRERVDVVVRRGDVRKIRGDFAKDPLPQRMARRHRVALVGHAHAAESARTRELEGVADDAMHAFPGVHFFLDRDLVSVPALKRPPMLTYSPSVFSRNTTKSTSDGVRPFSGHRRSSSSFTGR